jgi:hypothetical protein
MSFDAAAAAASPELRPKPEWQNPGEDIFFSQPQHSAVRRNLMILGFNEINRKCLNTYVDRALKPIIDLRGFYVSFS